ncbi:MAG: hypothetical protein KJ056_04640 [Acidimicrobiia bacterium]|nr:hypothetical protein [Acidimicrobiia bacterium]
MSRRVGAAVLAEGLQTSSIDRSTTAKNRSNRSTSLSYDAALAALARGPGRPAKERNWELEAAQVEIGELTEAVKAQAIELAVIRGRSGWG